ncbi:PREDICTED: 4-nitrophenylphosphatase-like [Dufourea novaeangliae]|uniref:4-nitrophenylphosphatase n=1 Tax=Dufourea novaeangliae TaxID=178035 RepID=A0A154PA37_DUFNO|nr:PREDICTED: 4-nitrophenylphosphatase-like [Dufourea novaeangliae]KZC08050.1 4-nitrophenylphosphatase [Dufourea novaeangliae]
MTSVTMRNHRDCNVCDELGGRVGAFATMQNTRNLSEMTVEQARDFIESFDVVLSDCDGVLWYVDRPINGAIETLKRLQDLGKRVYLVSNNSTTSFDRYNEKVRSGGLELKPEQMISPSTVIAWYLKKINFRDEAYVIASPAFRETLRDAGIRMTPENYPSVPDDDAQAIVKAVLNVRSIKAIIVDFSLECNWAKMALAISCLKNDDVLYLTGAQDDWVVCGNDKKILGPGPLINIITKQSGRTPIECAKPSNVLKEHVLELCNVKEPKRCLFIGDTILMDMKFATMSGFQKLFVETGLDTIEDAIRDDELRPDYYISGLDALRTIIDSLPSNSANQKDS